MPFLRMTRAARLEFFKFSLYIAVPVTIVYVFNDPPVLERVIKMHRYVFYPGEKDIQSQDLKFPKLNEASTLTDASLARLQATVRATQKRGPEVADASVKKILAQLNRKASSVDVENDINNTIVEKKYSNSMISQTIGVSVAALGIAGIIFSRLNQ